MTITPTRETPVRQRAALETSGRNVDAIQGFGRQGESRRDRRADRYLDRAASTRPNQTDQALALQGQTVTGRRYRIRFLPKDVPAYGQRIA